MEGDSPFADPAKLQLENHSMRETLLMQLENPH